MKNLTSFIYTEKMNSKICDKLIEFYESGVGTHGTGKVNGLTGDPPKYAPKLKTSEESFYISFPTYYTKALEKIVNNYKKKYLYVNDGQFKWGVYEPIKIQKYYPGQSYRKYHYENTGHPAWLRRHLVFMTYLNTVESGGETEWLYQKLKVKPQKGLTIIWPAIWTHTHRGKPAPKELKYICTGWYDYEGIE